MGADKSSMLDTLLEGDQIGLVVNQSSRSGGKHLIDILLEQGLDVKKLFALEHGIRGKAEAGEKVDDTVDEKTGIPIVSLYGKTKKPSFENLRGLDAVVFDLQDVGTRFYTYLSSMHYIMEACAESNVHFIVLDRPNPNGHIVDGPVLDPEYRSFVGMHEIPILHGMTLGELAKMIKGEAWIKGAAELQLTVLKMDNYDHGHLYDPPVRPSPNLPNLRSILLYPGLCLFEGTVISVGRGTDFPFQVFGAPCLESDFSFAPRSIPGKSVHPKHEGSLCKGKDFRALSPQDVFNSRQLELKHLLQAFQECKASDSFFNSFFDKLAGNSELRQMILSGKSESEIRASWQDDLVAFRSVREKYLIYPDGD